MKAASFESASLTDGDVIAASLFDPHAFSTVFDRHFSAIHRYIARRADRHVADDLASHTFVVAFERRASFRPEEQDARPWLYGIATNVLRNHRRGELRRLEVDAALQADGGDAYNDSDGLAQLESSEQRVALARALAHLDPDQRDVLLLYAWADLSYEQIASSLEVPLGTVRSRLSRARVHLRALLEAEAASLPEQGAASLSGRDVAAHSGRDVTASQESGAKDHQSSIIQEEPQ